MWLVCLLSLVKNAATSDPVFDPSTTMRLVLVPADAAVGSVIFRLRASDEEFDYPLTFELVGDASSSTVQIDSLPCTKYNSVCQANVVLRRRLEAGRYYDFQVSVKDTKGGMAQQGCSITATNFTTPTDLIFPKRTSIIMVSEDAKRGTELDYIMARKNPLFPRPVYLELWGSPLFAIRQKIVSPEMTEGTIFLLGPLDFEKQSMYHLSLLAIDAYAEPGQDSRNIAGIDIVVIVEDVQDVAPVFTMAPPVTRLPSGLIPGDKILQVHAEDGDKGVPREIRYGLVSEGNPFTSFFDINDTTGEITLLKPLDEISAITHIGDPVLLTVIAEEVKVARNEPPAMATTVQLALFLPERSNSPPYFENDHYVTRINENSPAGTTLVFPEPYIPRVSDDDAGKNGVFSLTLLNNNGTFEIFPNVAERKANFIIRVRDNHMLDFEEYSSLSFQIFAQELGPATNLSAIVNVTVFIVDANDNSPVFAQNEYRVELPENMTAGTRVVQVHADDVDTGMGGRIRYTQILGYLNTSLNLDASSGIITVSTNNHGFDREKMPEYHLYVEARDDDGIGNRAEVPLIIQLIDVNDETPQFEKALYEFILTSDLRNFTIPAFIKAIDNDAEEPNNVVRYELIHGNYQNKFLLNEITGQLTLRDALTQRKQRQANDNADVIVLTARAFDLGVPVRFSTTTIRVYPPESRTRAVAFLVPGYSHDRVKLEETLSDLTGGKVMIQDIKRYSDNANSPKPKEEKSIITATVIYDSESVVDVAEIQKRLSQNDDKGISVHESGNVYQAENRVYFWLLIVLSLLLALGILTLLLCCICPWCPLYAASRKRFRVNSEDDVNLVHRDPIGKQTKSVQVAEWMGRREAWSAERSTDSKTKPTRWEFSKRGGYTHQKLNGIDNQGAQIDDDETGTNKINRKIDEDNVNIINETEKTTKETSQKKSIKLDKNHIYNEDIEDEQDYTSIKHVNVKDNNTLNTNAQIDDDSIRRHEMERGSDIDYERRMSFKRQQAQEEANISGRDQLFIKDGNAEILRLITRGGQLGSTENLYINVPQRGGQAPQYVLVENSGKEILMRRFIEEQANGKQIIREHYQVIPNASFVQTLPNEVHETMSEKRESKQQSQKDVNLVESDMQHAVSNQSLVIQQELENSLKQQNALLRQILLEKEKLEEKYKEHEQALETQSLPCHSMVAAVQTQTDCEIAVQTEPWNEMHSSRSSLNRRRTRSENDDSATDEEYEYVRYSPPNSPNGIYWIKRRRQKKKGQKGGKDPDRVTTRKVVTVESVKRKIRTPIQEEGEDGRIRRTPIEHRETRASNLRRQKIANDRHRMLQEKLLHDFHDSMDEEIIPNIRTKSQKNIKYYIEDSDGSENEVILHKNYYSADSLENDYEYEDQINDDNKRRMTESVPPTPAIRHSRHGKESKQFKSFKVETEPPQKTATPSSIPKRPAMERQKTFSKTNHEMPDTKGVPRYMEWYVKGKEGNREAVASKIPPAKGKRKSVTKSNEKLEQRPEPMPRNTPSKEAARLLREDLDMARKVESRIQLPSEALNHPLLQHSEHRFEHEYQPNVPVPQPPVKLPHYMYPNTPPSLTNGDGSKVSVKYKPNASPIKENEVSKTTTTIKIPIDNGGSNPNITTTTTTTTTMMNATIQQQQQQQQHEDDHDSGIAMNSLLHGKRNKIADKKSVFTIAYDDVQIKRIQMSESDDPPMS
ncbi:hypothetical protein PVAND_000649 [Polypedilum vanderplanki]|uniref:Cadherin domain-containing protein n=1 Tax=Polypedilum vanderplanki TaxID=319348 RepID=A0A9J6BLN3_POLVA|nr:hypothetical protein PVAND_000649 [Polypedilum vanderplanki]